MPGSCFPIAKECRTEKILARFFVSGLRNRKLAVIRPGIEQVLLTIVNYMFTISP